MKFFLYRLDMIVLGTYTLNYTHIHVYHHCTSTLSLHVRFTTGTYSMILNDYYRVVNGEPQRDSYENIQL